MKKIQYAQANRLQEMSSPVGTLKINTDGILKYRCGVSSKKNIDVELPHLPMATSTQKSKRGRRTKAERLAVLPEVRSCDLGRDWFPSDPNLARIYLTCRL